MISPAEKCRQRPFSAAKLRKSAGCAASHPTRSNKMMLGEETLDAAVSAGDVTLTGDQGKLTEVVSYLDTFPFWFNIVTP